MRRLTQPPNRRLARGLYAVKPDLTLAQQVTGMGKILPTTVKITGPTALALQGLDLHFDERIWVAHRQPIRRAQVRTVRRHTSDGGVEGMPQALVDTALDYGIADLTVLLDRLRYLELITSVELDQCCAARRPGLRRAARLSRLGAESPRESLLRVMLHCAGLPEPSLQGEILDGRAFVARVDMLYPDYGVVIEYEGDQHRSSTRQWRRDIDRYHLLQELGYVVIRVTADHCRAPFLLLRRIFDALCSRGFRTSENGALNHGFSVSKREELHHFGKK